MPRPPATTTERSRDRDRGRNTSRQRQRHSHTHTSHAYTRTGGLADDYYDNYDTNGAYDNDDHENALDVEQSAAELEHKKRRAQRREARHRSESRNYESGRDRDRDRDQQRRRRRGHRATDSSGALLPPSGPAAAAAAAGHEYSSSPDVRGRHKRSDGYESLGDRERAEERARRRQKNKRRESGTEDEAGRGRRRHEHRSRRSRGAEQDLGEGGGGALSMDMLAKLDKMNEKRAWDKTDGVGDQKKQEKLRRQREAERDQRERERERERERDRERRHHRSRSYWQERDLETSDDEGEEGEEEGESELEEEERRRRARQERRRQQHRKSEENKKKARVVSGPLLEKGGGDDGWHGMPTKRGGGGKTSSSSSEEEFRRKRKKRIWIIAIISLALLAIIIPVAAVLSHRNNSDQSGESSSDGKPSNYNLAGISENDIPVAARGTYYDPFTWYDTIDFNVTYTEAKVGGLPIMGLNTTWNDDVQANPNVPSLKDKFDYGKMPIRGMNVGGWLSIEPFITPSFFSSYSTSDGVIDEWTLTTSMGATRAAQTLEQHYSSFITEQDFIDIRATGFDHVRIPFSYWALKTYEGDPYVPMISWRYLLRAIEYCRQNGLRVKLDIHGLPGSQNGWNHSGRQGIVNWLNGTEGELNGQRSLELHDQLSTFFAQPRYKNVVTMYGLANEPRMVDLNTQTVIAWTEKAIQTVRGNGITAIIVFGDGFMGLDNWQGLLQGYDDLLLDVHQYVIFNVEQIALAHSEKLNFACKGWTAQMVRSQDKRTGFGPTMCGEWSQADTDCTPNLNNVGQGTRWEGTLNTGNATTSVMKPACPTNNDPVCECADANADPGAYSAAYKDWLMRFAQAQMESFEKGWGWFYWTWRTEAATQWSYKLGMAAGVLPTKAYERPFRCSAPIPDFGGMGLPENY